MVTIEGGDIQKLNVPASRYVSGVSARTGPELSIRHRVHLEHLFPLGLAHLTGGDGVAPTRRPPITLRSFVF